MINFAICDDEHTQITFLTGLIREWAAKGNIDVSISDYSSAESFLFTYEDNKAVDILLLDIQMKNMDGITLAKKIRSSNKEIQIIFITGYMDYIADGYDVDALHYLLKPVKPEKFVSVLDKAIAKLARNEQALFINHAGVNIRLPLYEIRYLEVWHNYVSIYANEKHSVKKTLKEIEKELDNNFFRAGRSFIINLKYVRKSAKNKVYLTDSIEIPLSRGLYAELNRAMIERL